MVEMATYNALSIEEKDAIAAGIEVRVNSFAKKKGGLIRIAYSSKVKDHKFWQKAKEEEVELTVSGFYLVGLGLFILFTVIVAIGISWITNTLPALAFLLIAAFLTYDLVRMYKLKVVINRKGIEVNGYFTLWNNILECYTIQSSSRNVPQVYLLIFTTKWRHVRLSTFRNGT